MRFSLTELFSWMPVLIAGFLVFFVVCAGVAKIIQQFTG
jgi:hypothetical protein